MKIGILHSDEIKSVILCEKQGLKLNCNTLISRTGIQHDKNIFQIIILNQLQGFNNLQLWPDQIVNSLKDKIGKTDTEK